MREDAGHTITPKPTTIQLDDIFLAVKTTKLNHAKRLHIIAKTWFQMAPEQVNMAFISLCMIAPTLIGHDKTADRSPLWVFRAPEEKKKNRLFLLV